MTNTITYPDIEESKFSTTKDGKRLTRPKKFMLAGRAVMTANSLRNKNRFTYKISKHKVKDLWFVRVLTGPDNEESGQYSYIGLINEKGEYWLAKHLRKNPPPSVKGFVWIWKHVKENKDLPQWMELLHEGRCCHCGRRLTTPESIENGIGPVCIKITNWWGDNGLFE